MSASNSYTDGLEAAALLCDQSAVDTEQRAMEERGYWIEELKAVFNAQNELARAIRALKPSLDATGGKS